LYKKVNAEKYFIQLPPAPGKNIGKIRQHHAGDMGMTVTCKQYRREEHRAGIPDGGRTSWQGKDHPVDHPFGERKRRIYPLGMTGSRT
jgi:hypothetical protein